jgi:hypothetical protein
MAAEKIYYDGHLINCSSNTGYPTIFVDGKNVLLHRYVWIKNNGVIPEGYQVHHKDKNKMNFDISNLELVKLGEHQRLHALENNLGKSNKGKMKIHASGFCNGATPIYLQKDGKKIFFESVTQAARFLNVKKVGDVSRVLTKKRKTVKGWCCFYA